MKLTKDQIKYIDDYLIKGGIKYWDLRIEMIDHLASKLEKHEQVYLTKFHLIDEFGTSASLEHYLKEKRKIINKKYRKQFFQEILNFFKSSKNISIFLGLSLLYYLTFTILNSKVFLKLSLLLTLVPVIIILLFQFYIWIKKNNSICLATALFYFMFSFFIYNAIIQLTVQDLFFKISLQTQGRIIFLSLPLYLVCIYSGFNVFFKTYKEYTGIHKKLLAI